MKNKFLNRFDQLLYFVWFKLWFELFFASMSSFYLTTPEKCRATSRVYFYLFLKSFVYLSLGLLMSPIGILVYILWFMIFRKVLRHQNYKTSCAKTQLIERKLNLANKTFEILSINVCLLPDALSRENNLFQTDTRLNSIGNLLNKTAPNTYCLSNSLTDYYAKLPLIPTKNRVSNPNEHHAKKLNVQIVDNFFEKTNVDFLCMQEVWTIDYANKLKKLLHKKYPFIVYDAGQKNFCSNKYMGFESGLLTASAYPFLAVDFKQYTNKCGLCQFTSKGLLMTKVKNICINFKFI